MEEKLRFFKRVCWLGAAAMTLAACGGGSAPQDRLLQLDAPAHTTVLAADIAGVGRVLTDSHGHALYIFPPDAKTRVSCTGPCAGTWPPLVIAPGDSPSAGDGGVSSGELATLADPNSGARIVTYAGYPLYTYAGDVDAGTAAGQGLVLNGGPWYTLRTDGQPVTAHPSAG